MKEFQTTGGTNVLGQEEHTYSVRGTTRRLAGLEQREEEKSSEREEDWSNHLGSCEHYMDVNFANKWVRKPLGAFEQRGDTV